MPILSSLVLPYECTDVTPQLADRMGPLASWSTLDKLVLRLNLFYKIQALRNVYNEVSQTSDRYIILCLLITFSAADNWSCLIMSIA